MSAADEAGPSAVRQSAAEQRLEAKTRECEVLQRRAAEAEAWGAELEEELGSIKQKARPPRPPQQSGHHSPRKEELKAQLVELEQQNRMLKEMVKSQKSETRTKDMQNAQLRRKVTSSSSAAPMERERRPVPLAGQASPAAARPPINKMQVLSGV